MALEASIPSEPRNGQYLALYGFTDNENNGGLRIEVQECPVCYAVVESSRLDAHVGLHEAASGSTPKM